MNEAFFLKKKKKKKMLDLNWQLYFGTTTLKNLWNLQFLNHNNVLNVIQ